LENPYWFNSIFESYRYSKEGMLTDAGTWLDQAAKLVSAFGVLDRVTAEARKHQEDADTRRREAEARTPKKQ
jgi:hypothetical protein